MKHSPSEDEGKLVIAECVEIFIRNEIVHVVYRDGADIGIEIKREMHLAFLQITSGQKMPFLYVNEGQFWISKDAREYARKIESQQPFRAVAYLAPTLGVRLMAEFYGKFYKPEVPYKVFVSMEEAITWLGQYSGS